MKIGDKEYTAKISNQIIWDIEEDFEDGIANIMTNIKDMRFKKMAQFIWHSVKEEVTWDVFSGDIQIDQYVPAATEVGVALNKAFNTGKKK